MTDNIKKYKLFIKENNHKDIDPYGEEDWSNKIGEKKEWVEKCIYLVESDMFNFRHMVRDILRDKFENMSVKDLKDFYGEDYDEPIDEEEIEDIIRERKNNHKDIDPYNEEDWSDTKAKIVTEIKQLVEKYGQCLTMGDLQSDCSPLYKEGEYCVHLIERLFVTNVEVVSYDVYTDAEIDEYKVPYEELEMTTLKEIKKLIYNAIEFEFIEEDI